MVRILINPKQSQQKALVTDNKGHRLVFDKEQGYAFSDDQSMDDTVNYFKDLGFKVKGEKRTGLSTAKEEKKTPVAQPAKENKNK